MDKAALYHELTRANKDLDTILEDPKSTEAERRAGLAEVLNIIVKIRKLNLQNK
jgi:hypothetical protein